MRITSSVTSLTLFLALIIVSRADSDESDESDESGEHSTKLFTRISSLIDRSIKNHEQRNDRPSTAIQPYPYPYMGYPYYIGNNIVPFLPADYQRSSPQGHPSVAYAAPQPALGANAFNIGVLPSNANPNYPLYPNYSAYPSVPAYNPYQGVPAQAHSSDNKHHSRHSSTEDSEGRDHSTEQNGSRNGLSSMDHLLKSNTDYQETGHYFGPYQGRPLGLDKKRVAVY